METRTICVVRGVGDMNKCACPELGGLQKTTMTTLGGVFCDLYSLVRDSWRASRDWRWSFRGQ